MVKTLLSDYQPKKFNSYSIIDKDFKIPRIFSNELKQNPKPQIEIIFLYYHQIYNHLNKNHYQEMVF